MTALDAPKEAVVYVTEASPSSFDGLQEVWNRSLWTIATIKVGIIVSPTAQNRAFTAVFILTELKRDVFDFNFFRMMSSKVDGLQSVYYCRILWLMTPATLSREIREL